MATAPELTFSGKYPNFLRTIPPDNELMEVCFVCTGTYSGYCPVSTFMARCVWLPSCVNVTFYGEMKCVCVPSCVNVKFPGEMKCVWVLSCVKVKFNGEMKCVWVLSCVNVKFHGEMKSVWVLSCVKVKFHGEMCMGTVMCKSQVSW